MSLRPACVLLALGLATACTTAATPASALPFFDSPEFTPIWPEAGLPVDFHQVADFSLTDHRGETVTAEAMNGKVTVADFFFTACRGICPRLAKSIATIDDAIADDADLLLLSYSVTPNDDTVAVLAAYAEGIGVRRARWHLLTGDRALIYSLGRESFFVEGNMGVAKGPDEFLHTENLVLVDGNRRLRGVYNGLNDASVAQLVADVRTLLSQQPDAGLLP